MRTPKLSSLQTTRSGALALLVLSALSSGASCSPSGPAAARYVLSDGTVVAVDSTGAFTLTGSDGHALIGTAPGAVPIARAYGQTVQMVQGFYTFRRRDEVETEFSTYEGSALAADRVTLRFASASGAHSIITIAVGTPNVTTSIRLETEGVAHEDELSYALPLACDSASSFAGFGAQYNQTDQRGEAFPLWVEEQGLGRAAPRAQPLIGGEHTTYFPMPWWLDWRGFGVLVETSARVNVDLCDSEANVAWVEVEHRDPLATNEQDALSVLVFHGPTPTDVLRTLGDHVGRPAMPPDWAFSPWIGMQGGREAVLAEVQALEDAEVPFSAVWVQDWVGGRIILGDIYDLYYRWVPDETLYPNLSGLVSDLHARRTQNPNGIRFLAYANSFVAQGLEHFDAMAAEGLLPTRDGMPYTFPIVVSNGSVADFTNPATYVYVQRYLREMVTRYGFDGWMVDFGEWLPPDATLHEGDAQLVHNEYPRLWHHANRQVFDELRPDGDWVTFSRSGWTGDQREQQIVWIGDQEANFGATDGLPSVVPALLNLGLSGTPLVTHDIAGYSGGPSTKELYLRWTELGAFTTFMRTHEGLAARANWNWDRDAETTAHFRRFARIHEALAPEFIALSEEAHRTSLPPLRHLALVFPEDALSREVSDEFMVGATLLVAPVVTDGARTREVYLPPGTWFHVWTGTTYEGGQRVSIDAPIGSPPVFSLGRDRPDLRAIE
jgi:alpha-glucosidase